MPNYNDFDLDLKVNENTINRGYNHPSMGSCPCSPATANTCKCPPPPSNNCHTCNRTCI